MKKMILTIIMALSIFTPYAQAETLLSAQYIESDDRIDVWVANNCREIEVEVGPCTRSYPGQLTILIRETNQIDACAKNAMNLVRIDAKTLNCRPAHVTVSDENDVEFSIFVPTISGFQGR